DQSTVTRSLDNAAAMLGNLRIDKFASMCLKRRESSFLVNTHQAAVSGNIGREDGSQPPFDTRLGHKDRPYPMRFPTELMVGSGVCLSRQRCPRWVKRCIPIQRQSGLLSAMHP